MPSIKTAISAVTSASLLLAGVSQAHVSQAHVSQANASQAPTSNTNNFSLVTVVPRSDSLYTGVYFKTTGENGSISLDDLCDISRQYRVLDDVNRAERSGVRIMGDWDDPSLVEVNWGVSNGDSLGHWSK